MSNGQNLKHYPSILHIGGHTAGVISLELTISAAMLSPPSAQV